MLECEIPTILSDIVHKADHFYVISFTILKNVENIGSICGFVKNVRKRHNILRRFCENILGFCKG